MPIATVPAPDPRFDFQTALPDERAGPAEVVRRFVSESERLVSLLNEFWSADPWPVTRA